MSFAARYDAVIRTPRMRRLYADSGYFNVGLWEPDTASLAEACDRLVDELAAAVPADAAVILDVGCGIGAGTRRLTDQFPDALVIGVNVSSWQLGEVRSRGVPAVVVMDAVRLAVADGSVDAVIALESAEHFDPRSAFFAEALRVLRPGGVLAMTDMLFTERSPVGTWMLPAANAALSTPADYAAALTSAGFADVRVDDITERSWKPFCAQMREAFRERGAEAAAIERSLSAYVVAVARRP